MPPEEHRRWWRGHDQGAGPQLAAHASGSHRRRRGATRACQGGLAPAARSPREPRMNRRVLPGLLAAAAAVMCFLAPATYAQALQVSFGNDAHFPARAIIAAAPASHPLTADAVHVT